MPEENGATEATAQATDAQNTVTEAHAEATQTQTQETNAPTEGANGNGEPKPEGKPTETTEDRLTREAVNEIVRERLDKDRKRIFKRYGVETREQLDELVGKAQAYAVMRERYDSIKAENASIKEEMAFIKSGVNPTRYDDIRAHFKGKGLEFSQEALAEALATHPEWLNVVEPDSSPKTTITTLGAEHAPVNRPESEEERQKRIFGI